MDQSQFQKEKEVPESFDLLDLEKTSILYCQHYPLFHWMITDFQEKKLRKAIPIKSTPIS